MLEYFPMTEILSKQNFITYLLIAERQISRHQTTAHPALLWNKCQYTTPRRIKFKAASFPFRHTTALYSRASKAYSHARGDGHTRAARAFSPRGLPGAARSPGALGPPWIRDARPLNLVCVWPRHQFFNSPRAAPVAPYASESPIWKTRPSFRARVPDRVAKKLALRAENRPCAQEERTTLV